jgi:hypothetical protein
LENLAAQSKNNRQGRGDLIGGEQANNAVQPNHCEFVLNHYDFVRIAYWLVPK